MAELASVPVDRLPTLTEVITLGAGLPQVRRQEPAPPLDLDSLPVLADQVVPASDAAVFAAERPRNHPPPSAMPVLDETALVDQVLAALVPRIDGLLAERLNQALAPALARAADTLIRESRDELMLALRSLAEESLAQVLRRSHQSGERDTGLR